MDINSDRSADFIADVADGDLPVETLEQQNFTLPAVPVRVADPVQVQELPTVAGPSRNINLTTQAVKILNQDMKRSRALVIAEAAFFVGSDLSMVSSGAAAKWPANVPLEIKSQDIWYAQAATGTTILSVINDQWTG